MTEPTTLRWFRRVVFALGVLAALYALLAAVADGLRATGYQPTYQVQHGDHKFTVLGKPPEETWRVTLTSPHGLEKHETIRCRNWQFFVRRNGQMYVEYWGLSDTDRRMIAAPLGWHMEVIRPPAIVPSPSAEEQP